MDEQERQLREIIKEAANEARMRYYESSSLRDGYNALINISEQTYWRDLLAEALLKTDAIYALENILTKTEEEK